MGRQIRPVRREIQMIEFKHPLDPHKKVIGRQVVPGETSHSGDVYDAETGEWKIIPYALTGRTVPKDCEMVIVRPAR